MRTHKRMDLHFLSLQATKATMASPTKDIQVSLWLTYSLLTEHEEEFDDDSAEDAIVLAHVLHAQNEASLTENCRE